MDNNGKLNEHGRPNELPKEFFLFRTLFRGFWRNAAACFRPRILPWHALAIALTWICVTSGFDWNYYVAAQHASVRSYFVPALVLGGLLPIIVPLSMYFYGKWRERSGIVLIAGAMGQAALVGLFLSWFYKAFTGRMQPKFFDGSALVDISENFRFGFLRGGVFWGWPSSHTTVSFAVACALIALFPKNRMVRILALLYAFYVGIGVATVGIHWFSEFLAGAIFGSIAGLAVGKSFRPAVESSALPTAGNF
ncbi:MAG: phosphatase PAP2 family protein [bacterium]|nr:phosphatase PAP2 family protein [bacterium]